MMGNAVNDSLRHLARLGPVRIARVAYCEAATLHTFGFRDPAQWIAGDLCAMSAARRRALLLVVILLLLSPVSVRAADCRIQRVGGLPTLVVDGKPHTGFCYSTYDTSSPNLEQRVKRFAQAGCDIFNFVVEISGYGYSHPLWPRLDSWDFSDLDDRAHRILAAAPHAFLLPRIYIDAPVWWRAENPREMMVLDDGSTTFGTKLFALSRPGDFPSLASEKWRGDMQFALRTIIQHIEQSDYGDHIIGYQLSGQKTEEWYHWSMNCACSG